MRTPALMVLALLTATLAVVGVSPAEAGSGYQQPRVGQCRVLSYSQLGSRSNSSRPVSCAATHTAQTVGVGRLPKKLSWSSPSAKLRAVIGKSCTATFATKVGQSTIARLLSDYTWVSFRPTKSQRRHGARWFRCDLVMARGRSLVALPRSASPILLSPTPIGEQLCLGASGRTTCDQTHAYKATTAFALSGKKWPGSAKVRLRASAGCDVRVGTPTFRYFAPTEASWSYTRWVVCFAEHTLSPPPPPPPDADTTAPTATMAGPTTVPVGSAVAFSGDADDDVAVAEVTGSLQTTAGDYLQDDGSFAATPHQLPVTVTGGALSSGHLTWEWDLGSALPIGEYGVTVTTTDTSANHTELVASLTVDALPDTTAPSIELVSPRSDVGSSDQLLISGSATDDVAVTGVELQFRNGAGQYLQDDLTTFSATVNDLPVTAIGLDTVTAQFDLDAGHQPKGNYTIRVTAIDAAGNRKVYNQSVSIADTSNVQRVIYEMNEPADSTVMLDSGGNNLNGTINQLQIDTGVEYNGAIGYTWTYKHPEAYPAEPERIIQVPDNVLLDNITNTFTIEMRYRTSHSFGNIAQKGQSTTTGGQWKVQAPGGYPSCLFKSALGQMAVKSTLDLSDNEWHTLRCIRTPTSVRMYVDDVYQGIKNSAVDLGPINNNYPLTVGGKINCDQVLITCDYFTGHIDYLKLTHE